MDNSNETVTGLGQADSIPNKRNLTSLNELPDSWQNSDIHPSESFTPTWSLSRQLQMLTGPILLLSSILAIFVHPKWLFFCAFIGLGFTLSGLTGYCGFTQFLAKLPWNKTKKLTTH